MERFEYRYWFYRSNSEIESFRANDPAGFEQYDKDQPDGWAVYYKDGEEWKHVADVPTRYWARRITDALGRG